MLTMSVRLLILFAMVAALPARADTLSDLKARCAQLTTFWEYYGATRTEHSDGTRNWAYINACNDCKSADAEVRNKGLEAMKYLLLRKKFAIDGDLTAPPTSGTPCLPIERR
jgi:hypothetical protein